MISVNVFEVITQEYGKETDKTKRLCEDFSEWLKGNIAEPETLEIRNLLRDLEKRSK